MKIPSKKKRPWMVDVIRTSEPESKLSPEDVVRSYKKLSRVEQAFRSIKGINVKVRPVFHRTEDHVRAHFFMCMLATVQWHMKQALAPILFQDEELPFSKVIADPVTKAEPSKSVKKKKAAKQTDDGLPFCSFDTLITMLSAMARVRYRVPDTEITFVQYPKPTPTATSFRTFGRVGSQVTLRSEISSVFTMTYCRF